MQSVDLVRVFIASPSDVQAERDEVCRVIAKWNAAHSLSRAAMIEAVRIETHAQLVQGGHPQDLIDGQLLGRCDLLVSVFWSKLGTPTKSDPSGTVQEIRKFAELHGHDRVILFFCKRDFPNDVVTAHVDAVREFKAAVQPQGIYGDFTSTHDFADQFRQQLEIAMNGLLENRPEKQAAPVPVPAPAETPETRNTFDVMTIDLSPHANRVLAAAVFDGQGATRRITGIVSRAVSIRDHAIVDLSGLEFLKRSNHDWTEYHVTPLGFQKAEQLWRLLIARRLKEMKADGHESYAAFGELTRDVYGIAASPDIDYVRERLVELAESEMAEFSIENDAVWLKSGGHKFVRENARIQFAKSDEE